MSDARIAGPRPQEIRARTVRWSPLRITLALLLLASVLLWQNNGARAFALLREIPWTSAGALLALSFAVNYLSALKWRLILVERGLKASRRLLMRLYLVGKFFSNFVPSMIGGDIARGVMLHQETGSGSRAAASIVIERFTGLATLVLLVLCSAVLAPSLLDRRSVVTAVALAAGACIGLFAIMVSCRVPELGRSAGRALSWRQTVVARLAALQAELAAFPRSRRMIVGCCAYSVAFYALCSVSVFIAARAVGIDASFAQLALLTPTLYLVAAIPVSTNNLGWWEWCFSVGLLGAGGSLEQGLAVGLTLRVVTLFVSLVGGALLLIGPTARR
jgi:uncharacterized protein (TIRG00374 family)